jgi:hypothetical protein
MGGSNPADRGKRGTMRRVLVVDQKGVPLSVTIITGANIHDMKASTIANVTLKILLVLMTLLWHLG